jgi:hypothetical protein
MRVETYLKKRDTIRYGVYIFPGIKVTVDAYVASQYDLGTKVQSRRLHVPPPPPPPSCCAPTTESEFLNFQRTQESIARNQFRQPM